MMLTVSVVSVVGEGRTVPVGGPVLHELTDPAVDFGRPVVVVVVADGEAGERVVAGEEEAAALVGFQDHLQSCRLARKVTCFYKRVEA